MFRGLLLFGTALLVLGAVTYHCQQQEKHSKLDDAAHPAVTTDDAHEKAAHTSTTSSKTIEKEPSNKPAAQSSDATPTAQTKISSLIPDDNNSEPEDCTDKMAAAVQQYTAETKRQKTNLDDSISFPPVGSNVIAGYVTNYNNKVTDLFNTYAAEATSENCVWPIKAPATLPSTYPY